MILKKYVILEISDTYLNIKHIMIPAKHTHLGRRRSFRRGPLTSIDYFDILFFTASSVTLI